MGTPLNGSLQRLNGFHENKAGITFAADVHGRSGLFYTLFGPEGFTCHYENEVLDIASVKWHCVVNLKVDWIFSKNPNICFVKISGQFNEQFETN